MVIDSKNTQTTVITTKEYVDNNFVNNDKLYEENDSFSKKTPVTTYGGMLPLKGIKYVNPKLQTSLITGWHRIYLYSWTTSNKISYDNVTLSLSIKNVGGLTINAQVSVEESNPNLTIKQNVIQYASANIQNYIDKIYIGSDIASICICVHVNTTVNCKLFSCGSGNIDILQMSSTNYYNDKYIYDVIPGLSINGKPIPTTEEVEAKIEANAGPKTFVVTSDSDNTELLNYCQENAIAEANNMVTNCNIIINNTFSYNDVEISPINVYTVVLVPGDNYVGVYAKCGYQKNNGDFVIVDCMFIINSNGIDLVSSMNYSYPITTNDIDSLCLLPS